MPNKNLPYIIIFDIDQTLIGHIPEDDKYIIDKINNMNKQKDINYENIKLDISYGLKDGGLRPFVKEFLDFCKTKYKNVEFYVYSNSGYYRLNDYLVNSIEDVLNLKFNKPYFTFDYSLKGKGGGKMLSTVYDDICKSLENKYKLLKDNKYKKQVFDNQLVFIDDIKDNLADYKYKQIVCPEYNFFHRYNIKDVLTNNYKIEITDDILKIIGYDENGDIYQKNLQYYKICEMINERGNYLNEKNKNDTFFKDLINILKTNNIKIFNEENIKLINNRINANV